MVHGGSKDRICHLIWRCMQQTKWKPRPYQVGVKGPDDRESRHITSLEVWMVLDSHTWFDTPNQVRAMYVMLIRLKCNMPPRCKAQQALCNQHDKNVWCQAYKVQTWCKHGPIWPWDWYATRLNGITMQQTWSKHARGPKSDKGADLYSPLNSTKNAQNDRQSTHVNKQTYGPKVKAQKGNISPSLTWPLMAWLKQSKNRICACKIGPQKLLIW